MQKRQYNGLVKKERLVIDTLGSPDWAGAGACTEFLLLATVPVWAWTENGGFNPAEAADNGC